MVKVGVGDEFPAQDAGEAPVEVVHHHHYYRRRYPGRWVRIILWLMLLSLFFRGINMLTHPYGYGSHWHGRDWDYAADGADAFWSPYAMFGGMAVAAVLIGLALWFTRNRCETTER